MVEVPGSVPGSVHGVVIGPWTYARGDSQLLMMAEVFKSAMMPLGVSFLTNVPQPEVNEADRLQHKSGPSQNPEP
eukprot:828835-Rhodomonas_salina.1